MTRRPIGILMLDTRFPRPLGDIGHKDSFRGPVLYRRVAKASAVQAVRGDTEALLDPFIASARQLVEEGAELIGTSCGFLSLFQDAMQAALDVPVVTSALSLVAGREAETGVLTIDAAALTDAHLAAAGIESSVPVVGLSRDGELASAVFEDRLSLDMAAVEAEMIAAAQTLVRAHPPIARIVFECTNMGPYAEAVARAVDRPVFTVIDALEGALHGG